MNLEGRQSESRVRYDHGGMRGGRAGGGRRAIYIPASHFRSSSSQMKTQLPLQNRSNIRCSERTRGRLGVCTHRPPKSCIPNRAKTTVKRKRRKRRLMMDFMELMRDTTRFLREAQYLARGNQLSTETVDRTRCCSPCHPNSLGDLEDSEKSQRPQNADPKRYARPEETPDHLKDAPNDDLQTSQTS